MLKKLLVAVPVLVALSTIGASAFDPGNPQGPPPGRPVGPPVRTTHAPEFDARTAGAALALLVGGVLVLSERRRRRAHQH